MICNMPTSVRVIDADPAFRELAVDMLERMG
jgi:hypothetical protein